MKTLLAVENLSKRYGTARRQDSQRGVLALDSVSFSMDQAMTLAVVGPSGSGKSTLAFCVTCLEQPTSGKVFYREQEITGLRGRALRAMRSHIQIVFQDPALSLNPKFTAGEIVTEPLRLQGKLNRTERIAQAKTLLELVGLSARWDSRKPAEFSGGQRQRLAIARALALEPKLLILDEPFSALDASVQAQIANLLLELQASLGLAYLFITHDLLMAAHLANEIAVMEHGRIVETGTAEEIMRKPKQDTTRRLLAAMPHFSTSPSESRLL